MLKHEGLLAFGSAGVENKRGIFCSQHDFLHFFTLLSHVGFPEPPPDLSRPFGGYQTKLVVNHLIFS